MRWNEAAIASIWWEPPTSTLASSLHGLTVAICQGNNGRTQIFCDFCNYCIVAAIIKRRLTLPVLFCCVLKQEKKSNNKKEKCSAKVEHQLQTTWKQIYPHKRNSKTTATPPNCPHTTEWMWSPWSHWSRQLHLPWTHPKERCHCHHHRPVRHATWNSWTSFTVMTYSVASFLDFRIHVSESLLTNCLNAKLYTIRHIF